MQKPSPTSSTPGWRALRRCLVGFAGLVTLIALLYAEEDVRGRLAWNSYQRGAARKGIDLNYRSLIPPPVPDDQNFAMTPFLAPLLDFNPKPLAPGQSPWRDQAARDRAMNYFSDFTAAIGSASNQHTNPEEPWTDLGDVARALQKKSPTPPAAAIATRADAAQVILGALEAYKPVLDELQEASHRPYSRFNIGYEDEDPAGILLPHLAMLRNACRALTCRASSELALGRNDAAFQDLELILYLADAIRSEPILISHLVRCAILTDAQQIAWEGLAGHSWSEEQLRDLQSRLEKLTVLKDLQLSFRSEQIFFGIREFDYLRGNPGALGNILRSDNSNAALDAIGRLWPFLPTGWSYLEETSCHLLYDHEFEGAFDAQYARVHPSVLEANQVYFYKIAKPNLAGVLVHHDFVAALMIPSLSKACQKSAAAQTAMDECAVACALERFHLTTGHYPDALAALKRKYLAAVPKDVITGEPLKYRPVGGNQFLLYSVGWNEKDDDGAIVKNKDNNSRDLSQGDWAWQLYPEQ